MEYVLDVSKWRCGGDNGVDRLGDGDTMLLNKEGFMCCLGQFAKQVGVRNEYLLEGYSPQTLADSLANQYDPSFVSVRTPDGENTPPTLSHFGNTALSAGLMEINDDHSTTYQSKIESIREALESRGHTLTVINLPPE